MSGISLSTIRAKNAEFRRQQEILEAKHVAEELAAQAEEEKKAEEEKEEKSAKKPSKRKYLVVDEKAPKEENEGE